MLMMRTFLEENGRVCSAAMTDEQREEKNRKRRESYKRKKCYPNNKENEPVGNTNATDAGDTSKLHEDHTGDRILTILKSDDKRIERNKKRREAYRMKKDATQIKMNFTAEHHVEPVISIPTTIEDPTTEHLVASIVCTPKVIEHHADVSNGAEQYGTPTSCSLTFTEHTADGTPANTVTPHPSNVCTEVLPELCSYFAYVTMGMVIGLLCTHIAIWYYGYFYHRLILKGLLIVLIMAKVFSIYYKFCHCS